MILVFLVVIVAVVSLGCGISFILRGSLLAFRFDTTIKKSEVTEFDKIKPRREYKAFIWKGIFWSSVGMIGFYFIPMLQKLILEWF